MLIVVQIPMADLRPFRAGATCKSVPHWPTPDETEFVREFGRVKERGSRKGQPLAWEDEQFYVDARRALTFPDHPKIPPDWICAFRRLLSDGGACIRFEIGFHVPPSRVPVPVLETIAQVLNIDCKVRSENKYRKLLQTGKKLAALYAQATSLRGTRLSGDEVASGKPTVLVQFSGLDKLEMPNYLDFDSDHMAFMHTDHSGVSLNLWLTDESFGEPRATRTALLRLSAEHQCLKYVLRDIADGAVDLSVSSPKAQALQRYLSGASRTLSKESRFGVDQTDLIRLTQTYSTLCGGPELVLLQQQLAQIRPQVRNSVLEVVNAGNAQIPSGNVTGPPFTWRGNFAEIEYQAFFQKGRPPISAAWISDVTSLLCPAVCLIKIPTINRTATGFLIGKDLVLTNYHVVDFTPEDNMSSNLSDMELYFTRSSLPTRAFKLVSAVNGTTPLIAHSTRTNLDYVLLRISEQVSQVLSIQPFTCDGVARPVRRQSINILQHPNGEPLQISLEENGVSDVYPDAGTVQYISITNEGSSGSPCIDGDKHLVAIHHAARETPFGSIREGVLMSAIFPEIAVFL